ncbi:MAG: hypothetical protein GY794_15600 [bacterium]|nr:hypothetical protein [bacterium]
MSPSDRQSGQAADSSGNAVGIPPQVTSAIQAFTAAAKTRRIENICEAYQKLKSSANGLRIEHILPLADKVLGQSAVAIVASAYSHERCFMCIEGSVPCEFCKNEDAETRAHCQRCHSTGMTTCGFCEGTGWVGNDVIPRELLRAVWTSRLKHTHNVLEKYAKTYTRKVLESLSKRPPGDAQRHKALLATTRLAAKLHALSQSCIATNPDHIKHITLAEQKVRTCLTMLAW